MDFSEEVGVPLSSGPLGVCQLKGANDPARQILVQLGDPAEDLQCAGCFSGSNLSRAAALARYEVSFKKDGLHATQLPLRPSLTSSRQARLQYGLRTIKSPALVFDFNCAAPGYLEMTPWG